MIQVLRRGLRWLDDEVSQSRDRVGVSTPQIGERDAWFMLSHARAFVQFR